ncbi:MAG: trimeric intracellular cation channel family protein [Muribaculaceae bacterium]|nr:trimeric intracellular cation channel family protein [Muribaculaceae bacterium]
MSDSTFLYIVEIIGTFAFAISGIRMAARKRFDLFGAYVVGLVTAIGGGTLRDLLLDVTPFWMDDSIYLIVTAVALLLVIILRKNMLRFENTFFIFDTIGLALFVVVGIQKSIVLGFPFWVAVIMGTLTGAFGGILRDILVNEEPLIFRKDIYASACIFGGIVYWVSFRMGVNGIVTQILAAVGVIATRIMAVRFKWTLPNLKSEDDL